MTCECPECYGTGWVHYSDDGYRCKTCDGIGEVEKVQ